MARGSSDIAGNAVNHMFYHIPNVHPFKRIVSAYMNGKRVYPNGHGFYAWSGTTIAFQYGTANDSICDMSASYSGEFRKAPKHSYGVNDYDFSDSSLGISAAWSDGNGGFNFVVPGNVVGSWRITVGMEVFSKLSYWYAIGSFIKNIEPYPVTSSTSFSIPITPLQWNVINYTYDITKTGTTSEDWRFEPVIFYTKYGDDNNAMSQISVGIDRIG